MQKHTFKNLNRKIIIVKIFVLYYKYTTDCLNCKKPSIFAQTPVGDKWRSNDKSIKNQTKSTKTTCRLPFNRSTTSTYAPILCFNASWVLQHECLLKFQLHFHLHFQWWYHSHLKKDLIRLSVLMNTDIFVHFIRSCVLATSAWNCQVSIYTEPISNSNSDQICLFGPCSNSYTNTKPSNYVWPTSQAIV